MRNYIGFILAAGLLLLGIMTLLTFISDRIARTPQPEKLVTQTALLSSEKYDQLQVRRYLGQKGYIEILDQNAKVIYTDRKGSQNTYRADDLKYIPDVDTSSYYYADQEKTADGNARTVILKYTYQKQGKGDQIQYPKLVGMIVLDQNRNILYSDLNLEANHLTQKELNYMYGETSGASTYLQKYAFQTAQGSQRYLMIHTTNISEATYKQANQVYASMRPFFAIGLVLLMFPAVFLMSKQVRKPLSLLNGAIRDFADGRRDSTIEYEGPREFVQICDNFNDMAKRLQESEEQQKKLEEEKQKMLADISHDLKTPITVIQGYSKAVCDGVVTPEKQQKYLMTIYQKSNTLAELINSFYEYSRLEHPAFRIVPETGDICEYLREYVAGKYEELELAGFQLEVDIPEKPISMQFDQMQLKRVFENIITNSLKHNPGGTRVYVSLTQVRDEAVNDTANNTTGSTAEHAGRGVRILIGDDGVGIPEQLRSTVFEPFVVGDESRSTRQGTGLGLAIARKIVLAHHGTIRLLLPEETTYSTMFEILLPVFHISHPVLHK